MLGPNYASSEFTLDCSNPANAVLSVADAATAIRGIRIDTAVRDAAVYDLLGRRLEPGRLRPGLYIRNGRKVFIR